MKRLSEAHTTHLTPQFDENEEDEQTIEILTAEITKVDFKELFVLFY